MAALKPAVDELTANPKKLFLVDGLGAFVTAVSLTLIRLALADIFGMPPDVLKLLSLVAGIYAAYSFSCYFFVDGKWRNYLIVIAVANTCYCCLTIAFLFYYYQSLTIVGLIYFLLEVVVIACLIRMEAMAISKLTL